MDSITKADKFFEYHITRIVEQQQKTNELLQQILEIIKPPIEKGVEQVDIKPNDRVDKRKRR